MKKLIARQGDLLIRKVNNFPKSGRYLRENVIQEGEATGHTHRLQGASVQVYELEDGRRAFELKEPTKLVHEEHKEIELPKGKFVVLIEKEYNPFAEAIRQVMDWEGA